MATDPESRPLYFANGDFAKTVADIIASPRRGKAYASQDALYEISDRQRDYYTKCFRHLMKTTQGTTSLEGVLNGGDSRVVDFFRRSGLDNDSLSRIWSLSDVNEDGWLDINEFSTAMHLIVLRVKGHVAIPTCLPACIRPPYTPPHIAPQMQYSPAASAAVPRGPPSTGSWNHFDDDGPLRNSVVADKKDAHLAEFSDVPPLLVDSRPTAVKQTIPLLALKSPCGPPPQPPPRPQQRGHTRSASLDMMKNIQLAQTGISLLYGDRRPSDSTAVTHDHTPSLTISGSIPTAPPPPVPQRVSPPAPIPRRSSAAETQTEGRYVDVKEIERYIAEFDTQIADLLGDEVDAALGKGVERWARRCEGLRAQNAELEAERARMAQVRIQLELRLQELEEGSCKGHKPTSL
uniref:Epidermal growth factor receptor substrate 15-like 1 n=1 Tax=Haemonchus contortus TaxID=6289 RepID=A0A7I4YYI7_HAECO